jgi:hypothetical protein
MAWGWAGAFIGADEGQKPHFSLLRCTTLQQPCNWQGQNGKFGAFVYIKWPIFPYFTWVNA